MGSVALDRKRHSRKRHTIILLSSALWKSPMKTFSFETRTGISPTSGVKMSKVSSAVVVVMGFCWLIHPARGTWATSHLGQPPWLSHRACLGVPAGRIPPWKENKPHREHGQFAHYLKLAQPPPPSDPVIIPVTQGLRVHRSQKPGLLGHKTWTLFSQRQGNRTQKEFWALFSLSVYWKEILALSPIICH